jgi:hypothetical protein
MGDEPSANAPRYLCIDSPFDSPKPLGNNVSHHYIELWHPGRLSLNGTNSNVTIWAADDLAKVSNVAASSSSICP